MPRIMFDSVNPFAIPADAKMVLVYVDGIYRWSQAGRDRFKHAKQVTCSAVGAVTAQVGDVEEGCIWPVERAVGWVLRARADGYDPTVYVNERNDWGPCREAFRRAGVPEPHWLVANYNGVPAIPAGSVGRQYAHPSDPPGRPEGPWHTAGHWDESWIADYWPGVDDKPNERNAEMTLMKGPGAPTYAVDASGKRHILTQEELDAHVDAGAAVQGVSQETLDSIPDALPWNYLVPTTDSDAPEEFRPAHRIVASLYEHRHDGAQVVLAESDRADIAEKVRLGLLDDLAPLFELAERLKD